MQLPPLPQTHSQTPSQQRRAPPILLVKAEATHAVASLPLLEDKQRLLQYGKWAGLALLGLLLLAAIFGEAESAMNDSATVPTTTAGSYEDRMNAGIAELGGTYDSTSGTMSTNR